jgi:hypothetical protein
MELASFYKRPVTCDPVTVGHSEKLATGNQEEGIHQNLTMLAF